MLVKPSIQLSNGLEAVAHLGGRTWAKVRTVSR
jgi:hypothetical protein